MRRTSAREAPVTSTHKVLAVLAGILGGYLLGFIVMETFDAFFGTAPGTPVVLGTPGAAGVQVAAPVSQTTGVQLQGGSGTTSKADGHTIHSLLTSNGSPYQNFQGRIMYGTYKIVQKMPGGDKLTGFTRILHRMTPDELMDEIPTFRANPLHPECDTWCDFPVADRPNAVKQWMDAVLREPAMLKGAWILLLECDYVWMRPVQAPDAYDPNQKGMQFKFDYIMPTHPDAAPHMKRVSGGLDPAVIPASGPAPVLVRYTDMAGVVTEWERVTAVIENDAAAVKQLDWVREMYAWDIALALRNVTLITEAPPNSRLIAQPPHETSLGNAAMCHYTWATIYHENKKEIWRFEKRDYTAADKALNVPLLPMPPKEWKQGWTLQDGLPVTKDLHELVSSMVGRMNEAIATLPKLQK